METQARLQKEAIMDSAKLDLERDKLEADTSLDIMKVAATVNKEDSDEAMLVLKESMANAREAMKSDAEDRRTKANGRKKTTEEN